MTTIRVSIAAAFLVVIAVAGAVPTLRGDWQALISHRTRPDLVSEQDRAYRELIPWLPERGRIGYRPTEDWPSADAIRRFYLAEYALTPRVIVIGTAPEFVIAHPGPPIDVDKGVVISPARDPQLAGFVLYEAAESGLRIFRRVR